MRRVGPPSAPTVEPLEGKALGQLSQQHLEQLRRHFDTPFPSTRAAASYRRLLAHYYGLLIPADSSVLEIGCGDGELLALIPARKKTGVDLSPTQIERARARVPDGHFHVQAGEMLELAETFDVIIISETLNYAADVEQLLDRAAEVAGPNTRLIVNFHNNVWRPLFDLATRLGLRAPQPQTSWLAPADVRNLLALSRWQLIKQQPRMLWPVETPVLSSVLNRGLAPFLWPFNAAVFIIARLQPEPAAEPLSVSVVIPARNEAGNIEAAVLRTPALGRATELIFVEGHSRDNTWDEIQRVQRAYPDRRISILRQTGRGKGNAVREGFAVATGDVLMILDADLTMPPEELPKFYAAIATGKAEFANGCRLVYPMEKQAMQFANMLANKLFGILFSWLLSQPLKDTLCGTKVLRRHHYESIVANRHYFGDFDPFGDFDLIFGADKLNLQIRDIPIRYRDRTYGSTNIQRWRHGLLLFRMVAFAAKKLKFV